MSKEQYDTLRNVIAEWKDRASHHERLCRRSELLAYQCNVPALAALHQRDADREREAYDRLMSKLPAVVSVTRYGATS
jgi:hypothetical protein